MKQYNILKIYKVKRRIIDENYINVEKITLN